MRSGKVAALLAPGERVVWSGRSRPAAVLLSLAPGLSAGVFACCLALGLGPAAGSLNLVLSPVVESALRTVTPLPVPPLRIERLRPPKPPGGPLMQKASLAAAPDPMPAPSDADVGVGAALMVGKTLLLYLGAATILGLGALFARQAFGRHVVTDRRVMTLRPGGSDSVYLQAVNGMRLRAGPLGSTLRLDVTGRRVPFSLVGLSPDAALAASAATARGRAPSPPPPAAPAPAA